MDQVLELQLPIALDPDVLSIQSDVIINLVVS